MSASRALICAAALAGTSAAVAHHSFAMFDSEHPKTIEGVVKEFQWTNPHTWIQVDVTGPDGKIVEYSIEGSSPNGLRREGWTRTSIKPGDKVVMVIRPLKDGGPGGAFVRTTINGKPFVPNEAAGN